MNFRRGFEDGKEGLYWLSEIKEIDKDVPVILMTAYGEVELAVEALKNGATDFILKPWNNEKLYASVNLVMIFPERIKNFLNGKIFRKCIQIMNWKHNLRKCNK